jgi:ubiquinone/menaquinone biosynthesis C-methylase UbiE
MARANDLKSKELYPAVFSRHAAAYQRRLEQIMSRGETRGRTRAIELVCARPGMRVVDLACGPGNLSRVLAELVSPGGEVVGVDLAVGMIELARGLGIPNARFEVMDIEALEFPAGSFDGALCGHGLQFAPNLKMALSEAGRVLRPGALLAASVPFTGIREPVWQLIDSVVERWLPPAPEVLDDKKTRSTVRSADALERAVLDAGFRSARVELIDEEVVWESAEQLVSMFMGWWDFAFRLEAFDTAERQAFENEAIAAVRRVHTGRIKTLGRTLVLEARK